MQGTRILVIDDDISLCQTIKYTFSRVGADVVTATDGRDGLQQFYRYRPDLVLLDVRMPGIDGWEACRQIRLMSNVPIIMLTTLHKDDEIIRGLDLGADDFVTKPFSREVLLARARSLLRRAEQISPEPALTGYSDEHLTINLERRRIYVDGKQISLTATEFRLLSYLMQNADQVIPYQTLLDKVWGEEYRDNIDYVHVYLSHLRRKIEEDPRSPKYLVNERGIGYRFETHLEPALAN